MEKVDQVPDEQNLVDFSRPAEIYSDDNQQKISLINLKDLKDEGIVFDPEIPDIDSWRREEEKRYFTKHTAELQRVLAERQDDGEERRPLQQQLLRKYKLHLSILLSLQEVS